MNKEEFLEMVKPLKLIKFVVLTGTGRRIYHIVDDTVHLLNIDLSTWDYFKYYTDKDGDNYKIICKMSRGFPQVTIKSMIEKTWLEILPNQIPVECIPFLIKRINIEEGTLLSDIENQAINQLDDAILDLKCFNLKKDIVSHIDIVCMKETGNTNQNTFDFIKCQMYLYRVLDKSPKEVYDWFVENKKVVLKIMRNHIKNSQSFKKYGVPVSCIRCTRVTVDTTKVIHFTYELKNITP